MLKILYTKINAVKRQMRLFPVSLSLFGLLVACDAPLVMTLKANPTQITVRANLTSGATGRNMQLNQTDLLSADLQQAQSLQVVLDNSHTPYPVTRHSDGTLSFALPAAIQPDSNGKLQILLIGDNRYSQQLTLDTGALLKLKTPAIAVLPAQQVTRGSQVTLKANLQESVSATAFDLNWFTGPTVAGPWNPLSGTGPEVNLETPQPVSLFVRLDMIEKTSRVTSSYISPVPLVSIKDSDTIALTQPASGAISQGDSVGLTANIAELGEAVFAWAFAPSPQGPFTPLAQQGKQVTWEPPQAGSFYLRIQANNDSKTTTYVSSKPLVSVAEADHIVKTVPASGSVVRGEKVQLTAQLPGTVPAGLAYNWSYSNSRLGPFVPISGSAAVLEWKPNQTGEFYMRLQTFDVATKTSRTYTTSKAVVSVKDSDDIFELIPFPANVVKGQAVQVGLRNRSAANVNWSYSATASGPFFSIPGQGARVNWTPAQSGSFYLRAEVGQADGGFVSFTSATALVVVTESINVIQVQPSIVSLGQQVQLQARLPVANGSDQSIYRYTWAAGPSANGPWSPLDTFESALTADVFKWVPTQTGTYFLKVDATQAQNQSILSFITPNPVVFVNENVAFFNTSPSPANITTSSAVVLSSSFALREHPYFYAWSYGTTPVGPFVAIGGSREAQITWQNPGTSGDFYIKMDAIATDTNRSVSFVSKTPLVFVGTSNPRSPF